MTVQTKAKKSGLQLTLSGRYPLIPIAMIEVVERPEPGKESDQLFFNPRSIESFLAEEMQSLRTSIQNDGLHDPIIVRVFTDDKTRKGNVTKVQLIAGERRYRSISYLIETKAMCFDDETEEMVSADKLYERVPCRVLYNISDIHALRVAFEENDKHKGLTVKEEIALVDRLLSRGLKQEEIVVTLNTNITWVSQTMNFSKQLPESAYAKLLEGKMTRHVAVQILSYKPEDRQRLYEAAVAKHKEETEEAKRKVEEELHTAEDEKDIFQTEAELASGNSELVDRHTKKATAADNKTKLAKKRLQAIVDGADSLPQGPLQRAARKHGIDPKKQKMLNRESIEQFLLDLPEVWLKVNKVDPVCKRPFPKLVLHAMKATAQMILAGKSDPGAAIRDLMVTHADWVLPEGYVPEEPDEDTEE